MIYIHVTCDEAECTADTVIRLTGQQMFGSITVREAISKAWKIYKPKHGPAVAKCPEHWTPAPRKKGPTPP